MMALCALTLIPAGAAAVYAAPPMQTFVVNPETGETQAQFAARTAWWRKAKFGMFIHWGIYSVPNSDHNNTTGMGEWFMSNHKMQVKDYEKYAAQFDPVKFNASRWVKVAKDAGMKYMVITSKHHDGFDMFNSKLSDYNVVKATPWHHDPMKDLSAACRKQGIRFCFYHSFMDWHAFDYLPRRPWDTRPTAGADLNNYVKYFEGQLKELLTNYGPIGVIWFDGGWEHNAADEHSLEVVKMIRKLQPNILINNRLQLPEDFDTPEQTIPANALPKGRLWETCMTMNNDWGYAWNDQNWKSTQDLVHKLCDIASKGGNFLLNVGPDDQGQFPQAAVDRLEQVGKWMKMNGASIYGTTQSPFKKPLFDGRITTKGNALYLEVFQWPDGPLTVPGLKTPVVYARAIDGNEKLAVTQGENGPSIAKPAKINPIATVVELKLAGPPVVEDLTAIAHPQADGSYTLAAADANLQGALQVETKSDTTPNIGYWLNPKDTVSWTLEAPKAGAYTVTLDYACPDDSAGTTFTVGLDGVPGGVDGVVGPTGDWGTFKEETLTGTLNIPAGKQTLRLTPKDMPHGAVMNLRRIVLKPAP